MSINGRTNVDIVFHDTSGDSAIKIVELESTDSLSSGKVALVSGSAGAGTHSIQISGTGYIDASGSEVSMSSVVRIGLKASRPMKLSDAQGGASVISDADRVSFSDSAATGSLTLSSLYTSGTGAYTVFLYGT